MGRSKDQCSTCDGDGEIPCPFCDGNDDSCICLGDGVVECEDCEGTGEA